MNPQDFNDALDRGLLSIVRFPTLHSILTMTVPYPTSPAYWMFIILQSEWNGGSR